MMRFWDSVVGRVKCRLVSASLERSINKISQCCNISNLMIIDDLTATFWIFRSDLPLLKYGGDEIEITNYSGIFWLGTSLTKRPVIVIGMFLLLFMIFFLPSRVLFITVGGNVQIPDTVILETARNCGVMFGAPREHVRSEKVKNSLLCAIPRLQWACINTRGCVAEITVQERIIDSSDNSNAMTNIVAGRDGIITGITVYSGTAQCRVGQIVRKGQLLVSGYSDLGILIKKGTASAEIMAETMHSVEVVSIPTYKVMEEYKKVNNRYSLQVGKKLIKFYKDSGILPSEYGIINKIYNLTLPGGFQLPLAVIEEQIYCYKSKSCSETNVSEYDWLADVADSVVKEKMIAGRIIKRTETLQVNDSICRFHAAYRCCEMIAMEQKKEMYAVDGERN